MQKTDIDGQKIDNSSLDIYRIIIAIFKLLDKLGYSCFFQKTFLFAKISIKVVFSMLFFIFSNADAQFAEKDFT